jgi:hypothetical protein
MKFEINRPRLVTLLHPALAVGCLTALTLTACAPQQDEASIAPTAASTPEAATNPQPASTSTPAAPAASSVDTTPVDVGSNAPPTPRESLPEPGPVAIDTPLAAATAVETYFGLLGARRTRDADAMWGDPAKAAAFRRDFAALGDYSTEVDAPGGIEGAAGSMYVTVPVRFIPAASVPNPRPRMGEVVVRRVNDVPGSTEAQRRWHIDRIDVAMTPK